MRHSTYFLQPEAKYEPETFSAVSGEKNLRKFMLEKKIGGLCVLCKQFFEQAIFIFEKI
jgi:hypothetical protein